MTTYAAFALTDSKDHAHNLGLALENIEPEPSGVGVFELEDGSGLWEISGYFEDKPDEVTLALLAAAYDAQSFTVSEVPQTDWVAKVRRSLSPVQAGRFFVYGSHDQDKVPQDDTTIALLIEASMAFGTGHHFTTQGCLHALEHLITDGRHFDNIADIGCGTAVLAMAAAMAWPCTALASDIDPVAIDVARANISANSLDQQVTCHVAPGFDHDHITKKAPFDLVFANILMSPLIDLASDMRKYTAPNAYLILSGILNTQVAQVCSAYGDQGFILHDQLDIAEWSTLTLRRD
ncbi:MAG: 50S ribosomal protein L11 methyltransferase [Paracoccaceae bacterium]